MEKQLRRYLLPNILAMIGTSCYILADTFFISLSQGPNGITALNLVLPLYGLIFALGSMIGIGSATRYALGKGSNAPDYHLYFSNSIAWTLLVGAVFVALGVAVPDGVRRLMGALRQAGLLATQRGSAQPHLLRDPATMSLLDIYRAVEPDGDLLHVDDRTNPQCIVGGNIQETLRGAYQQVQRAAENQMAQITLAELISEIQVRERKRSNL